MAKKPKNGAAKDKGGGEPQPSELLMPASTDVVKLAKARQQAKKQSSAIAGELGQKIAKAVEDKHLDRKAFTLACALDALDDERLAITLPHLLRYISDLGLDERASKQAQLFGEKEADGEGEEAEGDANVTHIGAAARRVAERAGESA